MVKMNEKEKTTVLIQSMHFKVIGKMWYYVNRKDPMIDVNIPIEICWEYRDLLNQIKEGCLKELVKETYKNMMRIKGKLEKGN